ncbi:hypothetical protein N0V94_001053 [Neodidymelliopsis sp. IMI 364377]|nr:hypothetical protein N0V94_001053 [Neodidymelliopsis sp. IMI 364377]
MLDQSDNRNIVIAHKPRNPRNPRNPRQARSVQRLQNLFNSADAKGRIGASLSVPIWKAYSFAKEQDSAFPKRIPMGGWEILWRSQHGDYSDMHRRKAHLLELDRDLVAASKPRIAGQAIFRIERKFMAGIEEKALDEWEYYRPDFATNPEYLDSGARLYALAGLPEQAREIMEQVFELSSDWDTSVMMVVLRAHTSSNIKDHHDIARKLYSTMKERIGDGATIETYDAWLAGALEARSLPFAQEVFGDMVRGGYFSTEGPMSRVDEVLRRLHLLYALGTDISSMTSIALACLAILPQAYHGHIFGDWMKFAVVEKAPQATAQILDMMIQRGYEPEAFHFNMLLRALLRTEETTHVLKAEDIGWKMIEEARLAMRKDRPSPQSRVKDIDQKSKNSSIMDPTLKVPVPAASVSTFALIMHHHAKKLQWEHVDYLARQLKLADILPNTTIMNVLMDNKCRQGKFAEAWQLYRSLTHDLDTPASVFPDGESLRCLWKTLRIALANPAARRNENLPTPRALLRETVHWWTLCRSRYDADRFLQGLTAADHGAIAGLILHCFSYVQDLTGSLVALHVLRHKFDISPTMKAVQILHRQVAWVDVDEGHSTPSVHFSFGNNHEKKLQGIAQLYDFLGHRRAKKMYSSPEALEAASEEEFRDVHLETLSEFIRVVLVAKHPPELVEMLIEAAREAVGVPDLPTGDVTAFEVSSPLA